MKRLFLIIVMIVSCGLLFPRFCPIAAHAVNMVSYYDDDDDEDYDDEIDIPKATKAELAALKRFVAHMAGHTYKCGNVSSGDSGVDYFMSAGGMQLVQTVTFISKTKAKVSTQLLLNSSAARQSPTAYAMKERMESASFNGTKTVETIEGYIVLKDSDGEIVGMFKPANGTTSMADSHGNVYKKTK